MVSETNHFIIPHIFSICSRFMLFVNLAVYLHKYSYSVMADLQGTFVIFIHFHRLKKVIVGKPD